MSPPAQDHLCCRISAHVFLVDLLMAASYLSYRTRPVRFKQTASKWRHRHTIEVDTPWEQRNRWWDLNLAPSNKRLDPITVEPRVRKSLGLRFKIPLTSCGSITQQVSRLPYMQKVLRSNPRGTTQLTAPPVCQPVSCNHIQLWQLQTTYLVWTICR